MQIQSNCLTVDITTVASTLVTCHIVCLFTQMSLRLHQNRSAGHLCLVGPTGVLTFFSIFSLAYLSFHSEYVLLFYSDFKKLTRVLGSFSFWRLSTD